MRADVRRSSAALCALLALTTQALHIPGFTPHTYHDGAPLPLLFSRTSTSRSKSAPAPAYAYADLPFTCPPTAHTSRGRKPSIQLSLGHILRGERISVAPTLLTFAKDEEEQHVCTTEIDLSGLKRARGLIKEGYRMDWIVDGLPAAGVHLGMDRLHRYFERGVEIGREVVDKKTGFSRFELFNHVMMLVRYRSLVEEEEELMGKKRRKDTRKVIVGFEVFPKSVGVEVPMEILVAHPEMEVENPMVIFPLPSGTKETKVTVPFTFSVYWTDETETEWQDRWDVFVDQGDNVESQVWRAICISLAAMAVLGAMGAAFVASTHRREDTERREGGIKLGARPSKFGGMEKNKKKSYGVLIQLNGVEASSSDDDGNEKPTSFTASHMDATQNTSLTRFLAPLIGAGIQLITITTVYTVLYAINIPQPRFYAIYVATGFLFWVSSTFLSGYMSSELYKSGEGHLWRRNSLVTAALLPGLIFTFIHTVNLSTWWQVGTTTISTRALIGFITAWLVAQVPLVYLGSWAFHSGYISAPGASLPSTPSRQALSSPKPTQWTTMKTIATVLLAGIIPSTAIWLELRVVFSDVDLDSSRITSVIAVSIVGLLVTLVIALASVLGARLLSGQGLQTSSPSSSSRNSVSSSFLLGSASAPYIFMYFIYAFLVSDLRSHGIVAVSLFALYTAIGCVGWGIAGGAVGVFAVKGLAWMKSGSGGEWGNTEGGKKE